MWLPHPRTRAKSLPVPIGTTAVSGSFYNPAIQSDIALLPGGLLQETLTSVFRFCTAFRTQAMVPSPPAINSLHWVPFSKLQSWRATLGSWLARSMAWTAFSTLRAEDKMWQASLLPDFPFPINGPLISVSFHHCFHPFIPMTISGLQLGPHGGTRILEMMHLDCSFTRWLLLTVIHVGGIMKLRKAPRLHRSPKLARQSLWTVHWHQQQR